VPTSPIGHTGKKAPKKGRQIRNELMSPSEVVQALNSDLGDSSMSDCYERLRLRLSEDLRDLWDPTFARLEGPDPDAEAAYALCQWLAETGAAYERDAQSSPSLDWRSSAAARAALLRAGANELADLVQALTGVPVPPEVRQPPPPPPLISFGNNEEEAPCA
jgi:hypothetical protein